MPDDVPSRFTRAEVREVDLAGRLPDPAALLDGATGDVLLVGRLCGQPVGMVSTSAGAITDVAALARILGDRLAGPLRRAAAAHGAPLTHALGPGGLPHAPCAYRDAQRRAREHGPAVSVVVCTRDRADALRRCLTSVAACRYHAFEIVVVDNAPATDATRIVCDDIAGSAPVAVRYRLEPRPGLSHARNTGIAAAAHDLIAFVDDDERVDEGWLGALGDEFSRGPRVGAVSGVVLPGELRTDAQAQFEQFGGHSKGRGFDRVVFDAAHLRDRQPAMYPLPPFGVGANMAFRRQALEDIGGFDVALGAGTRARGAEDTHAFTELLLRGWEMVYAPAAVTWHFHRVDASALADQLGGYGIGIGAYYTALLMRDPRRVGSLLRLAPRAIRDLLDPHSARNAGLTDLPPEVARGNLKGIALGPAAYLRGRRAARPQAHRAPAGG